jgi:uncharacterized cupin superfamily protein
VPNEAPEASLRRAEAGLVPEGDGWFIVNVAESQGIHSNLLGDGCVFEEAPGARFSQIGINIRRIQPGEPSAKYHREDAEEAFLVLRGECLAIVEDEERTMRKGDFLFTPPGTGHVIVGAGDEPCVVLMVGARDPDRKIGFPVSKAAARYGASVEEETDDRASVYPGLIAEPASFGEVPW